jgi:hypothetical protein
VGRLVRLTLAVAVLVLAGAGRTSLAQDATPDPGGLAEPVAMIPPVRLLELLASTPPTDLPPGFLSLDDGLAGTPEPGAADLAPGIAGAAVLVLDGGAERYGASPRREDASAVHAVVYSAYRDARAAEVAFNEIPDELTPGEAIEPLPGLGYPAVLIKLARAADVDGRPIAGAAVLVGPVLFQTFSMTAETELELAARNAVDLARFGLAHLARFVAIA